MTEAIRSDGVDIALTRYSALSVLNEQKRQIEGVRGRLDAMRLKLEKAKEEKAALEDPQAIEGKSANAAQILLRYVDEF